MKFFKRARKLFAVLTSMLMLVQPILPVFPSFVHPVYAEEATASSEQTTVTPTPTEEITPSPTDEPSPTPTEEVTPTLEPTPTETPIPTETVEPTPTASQEQPSQPNSEPPKETGPPPTDGQEQGQILDGVSVTPTPTVTVEEPVEEGELQAVILQNVEAESLNLDNVDPSNSATLTTDKADYAPTDTAVITGTGFTPGETYSLTISSDDPPPTSTTAEVTADENGSFVYAYQLDGTYRPNYKVEAKSNAIIVAQTSFTDSAFICQNDIVANDEPGQKDLTRMCADYSTLPATFDMMWNWDDDAWPGGNTGDACALFDTNNDGNANYALCIVVGGEPAAYQSKQLYSCNDTKDDRCAGKSAISSSGSTTCSASTQSTDPFTAGEGYPEDTTGSCTLLMSDISASTADLIDVCSYPSNEPNSDPSDCIIATNAQTGTLEIIKQLSPTSDSGKFNLLIDGSVLVSDVGHNGTTGEQQVLSSGGSGTPHTFEETAGTGTSLSDYSTTAACVNAAGAPVSITGTNPWTVNITNNADITCTITNTRINNASLTIVKDAVPTDPQDFSFTTSGTGLSNFSLDDDADGTLSNTTTFSSLAAGTYSVSETVPTGWVQTSATCNDGSPVTAIVLSAGENVTCTFTNTKKGQIIVEKQTLPDSSPQSFNFTADYDGDGFSLTDGQQNDSGFLVLGSYTIGETVPSGWDLTGIVCTDPTQNSSSNLPTAPTATVNLAAGETVTCVFTNTQRGHIIVDKITNPSGSDQSFDFDATGSGYIDFSLTDAATANDQEVVPGSYSVSEGAVSGWDQTSASCDQGETVDSIDVGAGETVTCTFTNTKRRDITACKFNDVNGNGVRNDGDALLDGWDMTLNPGNVTQSTTGGCATFSNLSPGSYSVTETLKTDWDNTTNLSQNVTLTANQNETVYLGNFACATISGQKWEDLNGDGVWDDGEPTLPGWTINLNGDGPTDTTDEDGNYSFKVCQGGQATVSESFPDDSWYQTSPGGASPNYQIDVTSGGSYTGRDFGNTRYAKIFGYKYRDNDGDGVIDPNDFTDTLAGWVFDLYDGATGTWLDNYTTLADGYYEFTGLLVNQTYYVLEQLKPGWTQTYGPTPTPTPFSVQSGEEKQVDFANFENISISGQKFNDVNGDGDKDGGEPGLSGWTINLDKDANGSVDATTTTDGSGNYAFADLEPGTYRIREVGQSGWTQTTTNPSDITASSGQDIDDVDFGNFDLGVIQSRKYNDLNNDSTWDTGEPYLSGWTIRLYNGDWSFNQEVLTGHTGTLGQYRFTDLPLGTYYICEVNQNGWTETDPSSSEGYANGSGALDEAGRCRRFIIDQSGDESIGQKHFGNGELPLLTVTKFVTNDDGGTKQVSDFPLFVDGNGVTSGATNTFQPGRYVVTETSDPGYSATFGGACDEQGNINLAFGDDKTCTITNDDIAPTLKLVKEVVIDNGGTAIADDWSLYASAYPDDSRNFNNLGGSGSFETVFANVGYDLSESSVLSGYSAGSWNCNGGNLVGSTITLGLNEDVTCTITNDDETGRLVIVKVLINDDGGDLNNEDFSYTVNDGISTPFESDGQNEESVDSGNFTIVEDSVAGYETTYEECEDIFVPNGGSATCTITNDDIAPTLRLVKEVTNDDGGDAVPADWDLTASGDGGFTDSGDSTAFHTVKANEPYTLSESSVTGYAEGSWDCDNAGLEGNVVLLGPGEEVTCTITNDDIAPTITLTKEVIGGTAGADDFSLYLGGNAVTSGVANTVLANVAYDIDEDGPLGYTFTSLIGDPECPNVLRGDVEADEGENISCTITNTRDTGSLEVHKQVNTDGDGAFEGGNTEANTLGFVWGIDSETPARSMGSTASPLDTGPYDVDENTDVADYHFVGWFYNDSDYSCEEPEFEELPASVDVSKDVTTSITLCNARDTGTITIDKVTNPSESSEQFTINLNQGLASDPTLIKSSVLADQDAPDTYSVVTGEYWLEELTKTGWDLTDAECSVNDDSENAFDPRADSFVVNADDDIYCTFTNTERGTVIVTKYNDENGNGFRDFGEDEQLPDWTMNLTSKGAVQKTTDEGGVATFENMLPGDYTLTEDLKDGWEQTELSCGRVLSLVDDTADDDSVADTVGDVADDTAGGSGIFVLDPGETQRCVVGNHRLNPILTISKSHAVSDDVKNPGDSVLFTITVTATQSAAFNVFVTDLLPGGFTYRTGSWTSNASVRGDLKALGTTTEPTYASPGVWKLGDMEKDETVTLTYIADISTDQKPGIYKDLAWGYGCRFETDCEVGDANSVLSNAVSPGFVDNNFVGTQVEVVKNQQSGSTLNKTEGEVLGAATELPATGADELWIKLAALFFLIGLVFIAAGKYSRRFYV